MFDIVLMTSWTSPRTMTSTTVGPSSPIFATTRGENPAARSACAVPSVAPSPPILPPAPRQDPGGAQRLGGPIGGDQPAAELDQAGDDREELRLVGVGGRQQGGAGPLDPPARGRR